MIEFKIITREEEEYTVVAIPNGLNSKIVKILRGNALIIPNDEILTLAWHRLKSFVLETAL